MPFGIRLLADAFLASDLSNDPLHTKGEDYPVIASLDDLLHPGHHRASQRTVSAFCDKIPDEEVQKPTLDEVCKLLSDANPHKIDSCLPHALGWDGTPASAVETCSTVAGEGKDVQDAAQGELWVKCEDAEVQHGSAKSAKVLKGWVQPKDAGAHAMPAEEYTFKGFLDAETNFLRDHQTTEHHGDCRPRFQVYIPGLGTRQGADMTLLKAMTPNSCGHDTHHDDKCEFDLRAELTSKPKAGKESEMGKAGSYSFENQILLESMHMGDDGMAYDFPKFSSG